MIRPVLITGNHRSGTSVTANMVRALGAHLGADDFMCHPNSENPKGFHEFLPLSYINRELLAESTYEPGQVLPHIEERLRKQAVELVERHKLDGFKDPRTTILLPFWLRVFDNPLIIKTYRRNEDMVRSIKARGHCNAVTADAIIHAYEDKFWRDVALHKLDVLVVAYAQLLEDPYLVGAQIADFLNLDHRMSASRIDGIVDTDLHRNRANGPAEGWWRVIN